MKYKVPIKLSNGKNILVGIDKPELLYGATHIVSNEQDSNVYAINPITKEKLNIINLGEKENRFFIPAHINKDYEYAIKNNLPIKQVIAPYFYGQDDEKPREDVKTQERWSVVAVIKNNNDDSYLCEDAKGRRCKSFVMGGVEKGETTKQAALREIYEETGYKNIKITSESHFKVINHFYAEYKGVNRYAYLNIIFGELINDEKDEISDAEKKKHNVVWIKKDNLSDFINIKLNKYALNLLINGEKAFEDDGIMITNDENNKKTNLEVRDIIINKYIKKSNN